MDLTTSNTGELTLDVQHHYSVRSSAKFGRYLVASQDIPARTLILQEFPVVFAPADDSSNLDQQIPTSDSLIFCLNCCVHLHYNGIQHQKCDLCGWPLCGACNQKSESIHCGNECRIFQKSKAKFPPTQGWSLLYKSILILRAVLLIKERDSSIWPKFFAHLEHHSDSRSEKDHCIKGDAMIGRNIIYFVHGEHPTEENGLYRNNDENYDDELIQTIIGIVNVNGFGSTKGNDENLRKTKSMFQDASLFAHSCAPNCTWNIKIYNNDDNYKPQIQIYTSIPVKKGDLLTIPYNTRHLFYGTLKRQILIESIAHFECKCRRCLDPTELGSYISSIRCFKCENGFLISKNSCDLESDWECEQCGARETVSKVVEFVTDVEEYFDKIQNAKLEWGKEVDMLQKLYVKHSDHLLHKNHYTLQEISTRILELMVESLKNASSAQIDLFISHCDYLKDIADVILPGCNGYQDQLMVYKTEGLMYKQHFIQDNVTT